MKFLTALTALAAFAAANPAAAPEPEIEPELEARQNQGGGQNQGGSQNQGFQPGRQGGGGQSIQTNVQFQLVVQSSNQQLNGRSVQASRTDIFINLQQQNARCQGGSQNYATFYSQNNQLYLYGQQGRNQVVYVDPSQQGNLGYYTGSSPNRSYQTTGWSRDQQNNLLFGGQPFYACPTSGGAYTLWARQGGSSRAPQTTCIQITIRIQQIQRPIRCQYS